MLKGTGGLLGLDGQRQHRSGTNRPARIGAQLDPDDHLSFTRFGSSVRHEIAHFERCSDELLSTVFARAVASTQADLGGTELELALRETCAIPCLPRMTARSTSC